MDCLRHYHKHPDDRIEISIDWAPWLDGDTISNSLFQSIGLTILENSFTDTTTKVKVSGGVAGGLYEIKNKIWTDSGIIDVRRLRVSVKRVTAREPEQVGWRSEALD